MKEQLTLTQKQTRDFADCIEKHGHENFYMAKDQGAYVGAGNSSDNTGVVFYFKGCDPSKNEDWWEECRDRFGGDDFGVIIEDTDFVVEARDNGSRLNVLVTDDDVRIQMVG